MTSTKMPKSVRGLPLSGAHTYDRAYAGLIGLHRVLAGDELGTIDRAHER